MGFITPTLIKATLIRPVIIRGTIINQVDGPRTPIVVFPMTVVKYADGDTVTLKPTILGADNFHWEVKTPGTTTWTRLPITAKTLTTASETKADSGTKYRIVATNAVGTYRSNPIELLIRSRSFSRAFSSAFH